MSYLTSAQVIDRIGTAAATQLTTDSAGSPDTDKIDRIIGEVEGVIDGYLRKRVATPIVGATHPQTLAAVQAMAIRMVVYQLQALRPPIPEDVTTNNAGAIRWLEKLAAGEIDLPDPALNTDRAEWGSTTPTGAGHDTMA